MITSPIFIRNREDDYIRYSDDDSNKRKNMAKHRETCAKNKAKRKRKRKC